MQQGMESPAPPPASAPFRPGDPAPVFVARASSNPSYHFDTVAGRYILMAFLGSSEAPAAMAALARVHEEHALFDDVHLAFFGVSIDPRDEQEGRLVQMLPGIRYFWDTGAAVSRLYRAAADRPGAPGQVDYRPYWLLLDPMLRVLSLAPLARADAIFAEIRALARQGLPSGADSHAPVLVLPRVFEPDFCRRLIALYETHGGGPSGFMRQVDGATVALHDDKHKRRTDHEIADPAIQEAIRARLRTRLLPEVAKAFQFKATRVERYIVACYDAADQGFFRPHRDNTTKGTAHRRFAVTINLNAEEYEGGDLRFPEFGLRTYRAPTGGAVVFSCSLLHEALPVTRGRRFATLPFLYDEDGARLREANAAFVASAASRYRADPPPGQGDPPA